MKIYVCHFINEVREYRDSSGDEEVLMEVRHNIESVLFQASSAEKAFNWCLKLMSSYKDEDEDGKYDVRKFQYVGIYNLDCTESDIGEMVDDISNNIGFIVDNLNTEGLAVDQYIGVPDKSRLALFN